MWRHFKTAPTTEISVPEDLADCVEEELDFDLEDPIKGAEQLIISIEQTFLSLNLHQSSTIASLRRSISKSLEQLNGRRRASDTFHDLGRDLDLPANESTTRRPTISGRPSSYLHSEAPVDKTSRSGSGSSIGRSDTRLSPNPSVRGSRSPSPSPLPVRVAPSVAKPSTANKPGTAGNINMEQQLNMEFAAMFDPSKRDARPEPEAPSTEGVEYPRAAAWSAGQLQAVLGDPQGRQLFRVFLFNSLAEENLNFIEATEKLKKMKGSEEKKEFAQEIIDKYAVLINLSAPSMAAIQRSAKSDDIDIEDWAPAIKEVRRLLENDQFPRFRRSETYLAFLELILPRSYAEKWASSFEALLGNAVGRHHFRLFLRSIRAEENLRFWDAVVEFRASRGKTISMVTQAKDIIATFLAEGTPNEVFLPFGTKQLIDSKVADDQIDITLFDEATRHIEQVLRNDPYVRFLQSAAYEDLCAKLTRP